MSVISNTVEIVNKLDYMRELRPNLSESPLNLSAA